MAPKIPIPLVFTQAMSSPVECTRLGNTTGCHPSDYTAFYSRRDSADVTEVPYHFSMSQSNGGLYWVGRTRSGEDISNNSRGSSVGFEESRWSHCGLPKRYLLKVDSVS